MLGSWPSSKEDGDSFQSWNSMIWICTGYSKVGSSPRIKSYSLRIRKSGGPRRCGTSGFGITMSFRCRNKLRMNLPSHNEVLGEIVTPRRPRRLLETSTWGTKNVLRQWDSTIMVWDYLDAFQAPWTSMYRWMPWLAGQGRSFVWCGGANVPTTKTKLSDNYLKSPHLHPHQSMVIHPLELEKPMIHCLISIFLLYILAPSRHSLVAQAKYYSLFLYILQVLLTVLPKKTPKLAIMLAS